jgi:hypothetical protein
MVRSGAARGRGPGVLRALLAGGIVLGALMGTVVAEGPTACPGAPGFPYQPPPATIAATSSQYGIGRTDYNLASSLISTLHEEDPCDCEFNATDYQMAAEEFTW